MFFRLFNKSFELIYIATVQDIFCCKLLVTGDATNECLFEASGPRAILDDVTAVWMWSPRMWYMGVAQVRNLSTYCNRDITTLPIKFQSYQPIPCDKISALSYEIRIIFHIMPDKIKEAPPST